jgi:hypothetical protein
VIVPSQVEDDGMEDCEGVDEVSCAHPSGHCRHLRR